jgi:hypothetical protein
VSGDLDCNEEGAFIGVCIGLELGFNVGLDIGSNVGASLGRFVVPSIPGLIGHATRAPMVGFRRSEDLTGCRLGISVLSGDLDCNEEGAFIGVCIGLELGFNVGLDIGSNVGASLGGFVRFAVRGFPISVSPLAFLFAPPFASVATGLILGIVSLSCCPCPPRMKTLLPFCNLLRAF